MNEQYKNESINFNQHMSKLKEKEKLLEREIEVLNDQNQKMKKDMLYG